MTQHTDPQSHDINLIPSFQIPVIASFSKSGDIRPLVLGLILEDGSFERIRVDKIIRTYKRRLSLLVYDCLITIIDDTQTVLKIAYDMEKHYWLIYQGE